MLSEPGGKSDIGDLRVPQEDFSAIIKLAVKSTDADRPRIDLLYLRLLENVPDERGLAEVVCQQVVNYAIPRKRIVEASRRGAQGDGSHFSKLTTEARRAFIKYKSSLVKDEQEAMERRYTEVGEVIAFCVANHFLEAGQVVPKMALKTNTEMPVFGLDGIHVRPEADGSLSVFYLESKVTDDSKSGMTQYLDSAAGFYDSRHQLHKELTITQDLSHLDSLTEPQRTLALGYFNPYAPQREKVRERFVGVITYDESLYNTVPKKVSDSEPLDKNEKDFLKSYKSTFDELLKSAKIKLGNREMDEGRFRTFYVAIPSVERLKLFFSEEMRK